MKKTKKLKNYLKKVNWAEINLIDDIIFFSEILKKRYSGISDNDVFCNEKYNDDYPLARAFDKVCNNKLLSGFRQEVNSFLWGVKILHSELNKTVKSLLDFVNIIDRMPKGQKKHIKNILTNKITIHKDINNILGNAIQDIDNGINNSSYFDAKNAFYMLKRIWRNLYYYYSRNNIKEVICLYSLYLQAILCIIDLINEENEYSDKNVRKFSKDYLISSTTDLVWKVASLIDIYPFNSNENVINDNQIKEAFNDLKRIIIVNSDIIREIEKTIFDDIIIISRSDKCITARNNNNGTFSYMINADLRSLNSIRKRLPKEYADYSKKYNRYNTKAKRRCIALMEKDRRLYIAFSRAAQTNIGYRKLEKILKTRERNITVVTNKYADIAHIRYDFGSNYIYYEMYENYVLENPKDKNDRMFSCCERKLLSKIGNNKPDIIVVARKPCEICRRTLEKLHIEKVVKYPNSTENIPCDLQMASFDELAQRILDDIEYSNI